MQHVCITLYHTGLSIFCRFREINCSCWTPGWQQKGRNVFYYRATVKLWLQRMWWYLNPYVRFHANLTMCGARVAQSVQRLTTDWTTGRWKIDHRQRQEDFFSSLCVQTGSGAHPASCPMRTGGPFPGCKARPGHDADHLPHLVPRSWMSRSCTSFPPCATIGVLWDCFTFYLCTVLEIEI
jgi:hypothetical protein